MTSSGDYNYARFDEYVTGGREAEEFGAFPSHLGVGGRAPDAPVTRLDDGQQLSLSDVWRGRTAVIEFGSFT